MNNARKLDDRGLVSIVVTMIIMVLLSLIVLGFARVSRREQRQGLDRQLASQASYAAETGINDVAAYLKAGGAIADNAATNCNRYTRQNPGLGTTDNSTYRSENITDTAAATCVLVDNSVENLEYPGVSPNEEVVFPLRMADGSNVRTVTIAWQDSSAAGSDFAPCGGATTVNLPAFNAWEPCPVGSLRIDTTPLTPGTANRQAITTATVGAVLRPQNGRSSTPSYGATNGSIYGAYCSASQAPRRCSVTLDVVDAQSFYVRIRPIYRIADLHITANAGARLIGAQALVDSTGRANDVLKRLVARVPVCGTGLACGKRANPGFAIQSADTLCKLYGVVPAPANQVILGDSTDVNCRPD
jgi:Tfp pilus assembly protein PilV